MRLRAPSLLRLGWACLLLIATTALARPTECPQDCATFERDSGGCCPRYQPRLTPLDWIPPKPAVCPVGKVRTSKEPRCYSPSDLEEACQMKNWDACALVGAQHYQAAATATARASARKQIENACTAGGADGCLIFSSLSPKRGLALLERACELGAPAGCRMAADDLIWAPLRAARLGGGQAARLYQRGCTDADADSCGKLGIELIDAYTPGITRDMPRGLALLERACALAPTWCSPLATFIHTGEVFSSAYDWWAPIRRDLARAAVLFRRACDAGNMFACAHGGHILAQEIAPPQPEQAADLLRRGCDARLWWACADLGRLELHGRGIVKDQARAHSHLSFACEEGHEPAACLDLVDLYPRMHFDGVGAERPADLLEIALQRYRSSCAYATKHGEHGWSSDRMSDCAMAEAVARRFTPMAELERSCARGEAGDCYQLGTQLQHGVVYQKDLARAVSFLERACFLGDTDGCFKAGFELEHVEQAKGGEARLVAIFEAGCAQECKRGCKTPEVDYPANCKGLERLVSKTKSAALRRRLCELGYEASTIVD